MVLSRIESIIRKSALEIIPHVYQLTTRGVNIIIIVEKELTLIDTGFRGSAPKIIRFIRSLGRSEEEISLIIITHNHFDHIGGLAELRRLTKAKVAVHKADISDIENELPYPRIWRKLLRIPPFSALRSFFSINPNEIDIQLGGGEVLKPLGGLQVIHTPGHTPGSISLFSPQNKLLIVGDILNARFKNIRSSPKSVSTDLMQVMESVKKIARLDFNVLCFGHGRPLTRDTRTALQKLIEKIKV